MKTRTSFDILPALKDGEKNEMEEKDIKIEFPKRFRPLPKGFSVWWLEGLEHYVGIGPNGEESPIQSNRFQARKWCFAHHTEKNKKDTISETICPSSLPG